MLMTLIAALRIIAVVSAIAAIVLAEEEDGR